MIELCKIPYGFDDDGRPFDLQVPGLIMMSLPWRLSL